MAGALGDACHEETTNTDQLGETEYAGATKMRYRYVLAWGEPELVGLLFRKQNLRNFQLNSDVCA